MLIYNQDRDETFNFIGEDHVFFSFARFNSGTFMGIDLHVDDFRLGGFDTPQEIIDEINKIYNCPGNVYYISGYSNYDGTGDWNALCELMADSEVDQ